MLPSFSKLITLLLTTALLCAGCAAEVQTLPAYAVYGGYRAYPHTFYGGRTVYYFDGGWHYHHGRRWVYVEETPDLYHYRTRSGRVRNAPDGRAHERDFGRVEHRRSAPAAD